MDKPNSPEQYNFSMTGYQYSYGFHITPMAREPDDIIRVRLHNQSVKPIDPCFPCFASVFTLSCRSFPFIRSIEITLRDSGWQVQISTKVSDRNTHHAVDVYSLNVNFSANYSYSEAVAIQRCVYDTIKFMIIHELDESFYVDGKRPYDPHKDDI